MIEFRMPSMGADMEAGILREWKVKPGDTVKRGDIIAEVEAQKGIIEIECFEEGMIEKLLIQVNDKVPVGTPMALIRMSGEDVKTMTEPEQLPQTAEKTVTTITSDTEKKIPVASTHEDTHTGIRVSPLARRIAEENHIDLNNIKGTGELGAITKEDVEKYIQGAKTDKTTATRPATFGTDSIRMAVAAAMARSNREIPHYYLESRIEIGPALEWMKKQNLERPVQKRLLLAPLLIKAVAKALRTVPELNAIWENGLQLKNDIHIGFVVSLRGGGIIVPAIHDADRKSVDEIMEAMNDIIPRARALKLRSSELSDSTMTLTSLGEDGADKVFGIIYPPQVAVVGFGSVIREPYIDNGEAGMRPVVYVTLGGDHRATDGMTGSRFLNALKNNLQKPEQL